MTKRILILSAVAALVAGLSISCSKDSSSSSYGYLDGTVSYSIPAFVAAGDVMEVSPRGISHPEDEPFGYYWTVTTLKEKKDTCQYLSDPDGKAHFSFTVPDTVGFFTMSVVAFAPDYYTSSTAKTFTIVHPTETLQGTGIAATDPSFADTRDGQRYAYATAGGLRWMRRNLCWKGAGVSYDLCAAADPAFGRFYSWTEAQTACPEGWRLPTDADWCALVAAASGAEDLAPGETFPAGAAALMSGTATFNEKQLWEWWPEVDAGDAVGFCALPFGYGNLSNTGRGKFTGLLSYAAFWTADEADGMGCYRYLTVRRPEVYAGSADKSLFVASVRCVAN